MSRKTNWSYLIVGFFIFAVLFNSCENEYPPSIWDPNYSSKPDPVITSIEPVQNAFAGIDEITISGENFSSVMEENLVYFDGVLTENISASPEQLVVKAPNMVSDSILIQIAVRGAISFAEYKPYSLQSAISIVGDFTANDDAYAIEYSPLDTSLYVSLLKDNQGERNKIIRIDANNERHDYSKTLLDKASAMRLGPDGSIFYLNRQNVLCRVPPGGEDPATIAQLFTLLPDGAVDLDLDPDNNIFCAGPAGDIYRVKVDDASNVITAATYESFDIRALRVYDGYVYVAGDYSGDDPAVPTKAIWKNEILSTDGDLGENELVYDWSAGPYANSSITTLTFSAGGAAYIGITGAEVIVILDTDGSVEPLYPGVLEPSTYYLTWSDGIYLYCNRRGSAAEDNAILKINVLEEGAPYYGRP
jgi:hypothetical protein